VTTAVRGTVGHIAPEYLSTGQSSEKTDVFGFGILLLELISGQRALEFGKAVNQKGAMLDWVSSNRIGSFLLFIFVFFVCFIQLRDKYALTNSSNHLSCLCQTLKNSNKL
jgi:hypothetical protein